MSPGLQVQSQPPVPAALEPLLGLGSHFHIGMQRVLVQTGTGKVLYSASSVA